MNRIIINSKIHGEIIGYINPECNGPNCNCKKNFKAGRIIHATPRFHSGETAWPTYHFTTLEEATAAIEASAPKIPGQFVTTGGNR